MLAVVTPYAPNLVAALKQQVPASDRRWDGASKSWLVDPAHGPTVQALIAQTLGERVALPVVSAAAASVVKMLDLRYLGRAKLREDGQETAFGWVDGGWNAIFPAGVLKTWFGQTQRPEEGGTLYEVLCVTPEATPNELRGAWRRLARQWHPDMSREPDAAEQFRRLKHAYDILSDEGKRARYDAGRALEASLRGAKAYAGNELVTELVAVAEWAPPLRCGWVLAVGVVKVGRFVVSEILQWEDIVRADGATLVSSWPVGAERFMEDWVI